MRYVISLLLACVFVLPVRAAELLSGPMVGHTTSSSATIWVETSEPTLVRVHYWVDAGSAPLVKRTATGRTADTSPHTGVVTLPDIGGARSVHYELEIDGRLLRPETPQVFSPLPETDGTANFSFAFASCMSMRAVPVQPVWEQVALYRPDFLMLVGDNNYMPGQDDAYDISEAAAAYVMGRTHRYLRDLAGLRTLLATTPTYAVWDDHDYGPNDADRTFRWRELSLELFKKYWPNPAAGTPGVPGIFHSFRVADVEFFMLDDRYHRDPNHAPDRRTMFGDGQLAWLRDGLSASTATFKVIVNGQAMLPDKRNRSEYWARYGDERDRFIEWIYDEEITGVFFLSGDWHVGSLIRMEFTPEGYPLYELISSNAGVRDMQDPRLHLEPGHRATGHSRSFPGPIVNDVLEYNFGLVTVSGAPESRTATLQIIDHTGEVRVKHVLTEKNLSPAWND